jgi:hypothetical protein
MRFCSLPLLGALTASAQVDAGAVSGVISDRTGAASRPIRHFGRQGRLPAAEEPAFRPARTGSSRGELSARSRVCFGNSGRNILRGPGFIDLDLGISREFAIRERVRLSLRAESFNTMNHPNFGIPNMAIGNAQVGILGTTANPERQNQVAMKLSF